MWLNGDVLMCACPDCRAPMSVRQWLMVADCWQCGTSIELTEEQERQAQRLLADAAVQRRVAEAHGVTDPHLAAVPPPISTRAAIGSPSIRPQPKSRIAAPAARPRSAEPARGLPADGYLAESLSGQRVLVPSSRRSPQGPLRHPPSRNSSRLATPAAGHRLFDATPAWLISLVLHVVLLTLLALFTLEKVPEEESITLSTAVSRADVEGGPEFKIDPQQEVAFDLPVPQQLNLTDKKIREVVIKADQDARELRLDPGVDEPNLPALSQIKAAVGGGRGLGGGRNLAARDPRLRVEIVHQEGGTTMTEAAVSRGLRWLARHQNEDGHWSLHAFNHSSGCSCGGTGGIHSDSAGTSLALLPFLGAGQTHLVGRYKDYVSAGLRWLMSKQKTNGDLRGDSSGNAGMYAHGQGAIVLCEAFLMTGDEELRVPAQRSIDFIVQAQHSAGGWRYNPGQPGDTSVLGWQLMALQSARAANLSVPPATLELANHYLDTVQHRGGAAYAYLPGQQPTHIMTAEALLCRMYLGWELDNPSLITGVQSLVDDHLPRERDPNIYYWYYATQALHHVGGASWEKWNSRMREILVESQERQGHEAGSWAPRGEHAPAGGRIYMTALAICSLEVYYRHLPIFRQLQLE